MLGFISDLHLEPLDNERTQAFYNFLEEVSQKYESLYILGDLFEYWIGDDDDSSVILQIKQSLYRLSQKGVGLFFIHGNRDFLIGDKFASESNVKILDDMEDSQAIEFLIERLKSAKTNEEFFSAMKSGNGNGKKK